MSDNVIILGAGFSYDAGIPLLGEFIQRMWEYSLRGKAGKIQLSPSDKQILLDALEIRRELDGYHGRVTFDDRNIEDVLSMLAFNVLGGGRSERNKLGDFTNAISKTIELSCNVKHSGYQANGQYKIITDGDEIYRQFWKALFGWVKRGNALPTIITFNYDLVLERALHQILINTIYSVNDNKAPFDTFSLDYKYRHFPPEYYQVKPARYNKSAPFEYNEGTVIEKIAGPGNMGKHVDIEILKLHGSLNFPKDKAKQEKFGTSLVNVVDDPYILPPVSNKRSNGAGDDSWQVALNRLREAKNVVFVGYSLPRTDMYMQFFLKAALGPNQELNKLFVFDPVLWEDGEASKEMRSRYTKCFAEQLRPRIEFRPTALRDVGRLGTTRHFVHVLEEKPELIFF